MSEDNKYKLQIDPEKETHNSLNDNNFVKEKPKFKANPKKGVYLILTNIFI